MSWLTSLPVWAILFLSLLIVGSVSSASYLLLHKKTGEHRERTGMAAAAYMTALGSLFAILTGFLINSEYASSPKFGWKRSGGCKPSCLGD